MRIAQLENQIDETEVIFISTQRFEGLLCVKCHA